MAPPNTPDTSNLDVQLDAMIAQLAVLSFAQDTATSAFTDRFSSLDSSVFKNLAETLCSHSTKLSGLVNNDPSEKLSHHIKLGDKPPLRYCDVIYDNKTKQCTLLLKMAGAEKFEGSYKRATKQIAIQIDPDTGLRFCPVVSLKAKDDSIEKKVITEATNEGALTFKCVSGSDSRGKTRTKFKRKKKQRAVQLDKGITVTDAMKDAMKTVTDVAQKKEEALLSNLCHYMKQIGFQLDQMHQNGHTHFDVKPDNILVRPSEVTYDGQTTAPIFTLIDIPNKKINPSEMIIGSSLGMTRTMDYSPEFQKRDVILKVIRKIGLKKPTNVKIDENVEKIDLIEDLQNYKVAVGVRNKRLRGHMFDSYAFLLCFGEQIPKMDTPGASKDTVELFQDFFVEKMHEFLIEAALAQNTDYEWQWPDSLTVSQITQSFTQMIKDKCSDKVFLQDALQDAEKFNEIPSQPFNEKGTLPEDATTLLKATAELQHLKDKLKQTLSSLNQSRSLTTFFRSLSYNNSDFQAAKKELMDFCEREEDVGPDGIKSVIAAITYIEKNKIVKNPIALVTLKSVKVHLTELHNHRESRSAITDLSSRTEPTTRIFGPNAMASMYRRGETAQNRCEELGHLVSHGDPKKQAHLLEKECDDRTLSPNN